MQSHSRLADAISAALTKMISGVCLAALLGLVLLTAPPGAAPAQGVAPARASEAITTVSVDAKQEWTDTGVDLKAGELLTITAEGKWTFKAGGELKDADGEGWKYDTAVLKDQSFAALIGKVGEAGTPFLVGKAYSKPSPSTGRLKLQINDNPKSLSDNSGTLDVKVRHQAAVSPGEEFHDTITLQNGIQVQGPKMVVVPAGTFTMGAPTGESGSEDHERPLHKVTIAKPFAIGVYEVTFEDYDRFAEDEKRAKPGDEGWGRGRRPVINVSWDDARAYAEWLSQRTGERYRLPSEAEWEYAARAGTQTAYWWRDDPGRNRANCSNCGSPWDGKQTAPVGSFEKNRFGLHDTAGNVYEWVQDRWHGSYVGAPTDGSPWIWGDRDARVLRGGSWHFPAQFVRSAARDRASDNASGRNVIFGFRVARDL